MIGKYRDICTVMRRFTPSASPDDLNQPADSYVPLANRPIERITIEPLAGAEIEEMGQIVGTVGCRVEMRFREDLTTDCRLRVTSSATPYWLSVRSLPADPDFGKRKRIVFLAVREEEPA